MSSKAVILAAGKGTRMRTELPKVLVTLFDKPLVRFVIESVFKSKLGKPLVVIGHQADLIRAILGEEVDYAYQSTQVGTGHALAAARTILEGKYDNLVVLYGDMPFITADTIDRITKIHEETGAVLTFTPTKVPDYKDWRSILYHYGRVIRNLGDQIVDIREVKDANDIEKEITEVNPSFYCFKSQWLWDNINKLTNINAKGEYYLSDMIKFAFQQGQKITAMEIEAMETIGINTLEDLTQAETLLQKRMVK